MGPGQLRFMGSYALDTELGLDEGDDLQRHYYARMAPDAQSHGAFVNVLRGSANLRASLRSSDKGAAARQRFNANAREHFQQSAWLNALR